MRGARPELRVIEPSANLPEVGRPEWRYGIGAAAEPIQDSDGHLETGTVGEQVLGHQTGDLKRSSPDDRYPPPGALPEEMRTEWCRIIADLQERHLFNESMLGVVRSYVMAQWTAAQAEKSIETDGVMVKGAGGALKPNPATGLLRSSRDMISRLAAELGLTPTSRSRKSLRPPGQGELFKSEWDL